MKEQITYEIEHESFNWDGWISNGAAFYLLDQATHRFSERRDRYPNEKFRLVRVTTIREVIEG